MVDRAVVAEWMVVLTDRAAAEAGTEIAEVWAMTAPGMKAMRAVKAGSRMERYRRCLTARCQSFREEGCGGLETLKKAFSKYLACRTAG